jgi:hypothetical protein
LKKIHDLEDQYHTISEEIFSLHMDLTKNMVTMGNSCFWLVEILKSSPMTIKNPNDL